MADHPLNPTRETLQALAKSEDPGPVVMVNLLEFAGEAGQQSYAQYAKVTEPLVGQLGGRILYIGQVQEQLVGDSDWDAIALVYYPSRQAFLAMVTSPEYREGMHLREQGLKRTELLATRPLRQPAPAP